MREKKKRKIKTPVKGALKKPPLKKNITKKPLARRKRTLPPKLTSILHQESPLAAFYSGSSPTAALHEPAAVFPPKELPVKYHEDKVVLQVRDPWWLYTYWEVQDSTLENIRKQFVRESQGAKLVLRVYDVSFIIFNGRNAHRFFDIEVNFDVSNWYIDAGLPGRSFCVEIGLKLNDGRFIMIARSNIVTMPLDGPSWVLDEEWMIPDDLFARLYGMGFGMGVSSPLAKGFWRHLKFPVSSMGLFSISSPSRKQPPRKERSFWLEVKTELIVHVATQSNARVFVQGQEVKLNPDGTFSTKMPLNDGTKIVPVEAWSSDELEHRTITPIVSKTTQSTMSQGHSGPVSSEKTPIGSAKS